MTALTDIIERLESATGPNFKLDCDIRRMFDPEHAEHFTIPPNFTASLDAAIALCERVFPAANWQLCSSGGCTLIYGNTPDGHDILEAGTQTAPTPALALCLAICRAMAAREGE